MSRPKGSKNKKPEEISPEITTPEETSQEIDELLGDEKKPKIFLGYNPITGEEVWH